MNSIGLLRVILNKLKIIKSDLIEQYECDTLDYYDSITDLEDVIDDIEDYLNKLEQSIIDILQNKK